MRTTYIGGSDSYHGCDNFIMQSYIMLSLNVQIVRRTFKKIEMNVVELLVEAILRTL